MKRNNNKSNNEGEDELPVVATTNIGRISTNNNNSTNTSTRIYIGGLDPYKLTANEIIDRLRQQLEEKDNYQQSYKIHDVFSSSQLSSASYVHFTISSVFDNNNNDETTTTTTVTKGEAISPFDIVCKLFHNVKWKGCKLKVELAKPHFLERLQEEIQQRTKINTNNSNIDDSNIQDDTTPTTKTKVDGADLLTINDNKELSSSNLLIPRHLRIKKGYGQERIKVDTKPIVVTNWKSFTIISKQMKLKRESYQKLIQKHKITTGSTSSTSNNNKQSLNDSTIDDKQKIAYFNRAIHFKFNNEPSKIDSIHPTNTKNIDNDNDDQGNDLEEIVEIIDDDDNDDVDNDDDDDDDSLDNHSVGIEQQVNDSTSDDDDDNDDDNNDDNSLNDIEHLDDKSDITNNHQSSTIVIDESEEDDDDNDDNYTTNSSNDDNDGDDDDDDNDYERNTTTVEDDDDNNSNKIVDMNKDVDKNLSILSQLFPELRKRHSDDQRNTSQKNHDENNMDIDKNNISKKDTTKQIVPGWTESGQMVRYDPRKVKIAQKEVAKEEEEEEEKEEKTATDTSIDSLSTIAHPDSSQDNVDIIDTEQQKSMNKPKLIATIDSTTDNDSNTTTATKPLKHIYDQKRLEDVFREAREGAAAAATCSSDNTTAIIQEQVPAPVFGFSFFGPCTISDNTTIPTLKSNQQPQHKVTGTVVDNNENMSDEDTEVVLPPVVTSSNLSKRKRVRCYDLFDTVVSTNTTTATTKKGSNTTSTSTTSELLSTIIESTLYNALPNKEGYKIINDLQAYKSDPTHVENWNNERKRLTNAWKQKVKYYHHQQQNNNNNSTPSYGGKKRTKTIR